MTECNDDAIKLVVVSTVVDASPQGSTFASAAPDLPTSRKNETKLEEYGVTVFVDKRIPSEQIVTIDRLVRVGKLADALDVLKKETKKIDEDEYEDKVMAQSLNSGDEKKRGETAFVPVNYKVLKGHKTILPRPEDVMVAAPSQPRATTRTTSERVFGSSNSNDTNNRLLVGAPFERERSSAGGKKSSNNTLFESVHKKIAVCKKQLLGSTNNDMNETLAITRLLMALLKLAETLDTYEEELGHKEEVLGLINNNNSPLKLQHHHRPDPPMSPTLVLTTTSTTAVAAATTTSSSPPSSHKNHSPPMSPNSVVGTTTNTSSTPTAILKDRPLRSPNSVVTTSTAKSSSPPSVVGIAEQTISSSNSSNTQGGGGWFPEFNSSVGGDGFISSSSSDSSSPSPITVATTTAITTTSGYNDDNTSSRSVFDKLIQAEQIVASLALFKEHDDEYDDAAAAIKASFPQQRSLSPRSVMSSSSGPWKESHHSRKQQQQQQPMKASSGGITVVPDNTSTTDGNNVSTITISATNANMDGFNWIHRNMELCNKILMDSMNDFDEQTVELTTILLEEIGTDLESIEVKLVENQLYFF